MRWILVGLGNPGDEYEKTRHNVGRVVVDALRHHLGFPDWEQSSGAHALYTHGKRGRDTIELLLPETFMNRSGKAVQYACTKHKVPPEHVIIVHDDIDMPLGSLKVLYGRGSGGHRGVESIARALKTKDFTRLKVGVLATTPAGKPKKPKGEQKVHDFIMGTFSKKELPAFKNVTRRAVEALTLIIEEGRAQAMNEVNSK